MKKIERKTSVSSQFAGLCAALSALFAVQTANAQELSLSTPANETLIVDKSPLFSGTCVADSKVEIRLVDTPLIIEDAVCSATCSDAGLFSCQPIFILQSGTYSVAAYDESGAQSSAVSFSVEHSQTNAPKLVTPPDGSVFYTRTVEFQAECQSGEVTFYNAATGAELCSETCVGHVAACSAELAWGARSVYAEESVENSGTLRSRTASFVLEAQAIDAPVLTSHKNGATYTEDSSVLSGTCLAAATVRGYEVTESGIATEYCTATCSEDGEFSCSGELFGTGSHVVRMAQTSAAGVQSDNADTSFTIDANYGFEMAVTSPAENAAVSTASAVISGTCEPGIEIRVNSAQAGIEGDELCRAQCETNGTFACSPALFLAGAQSIKVHGYDKFGTEVAGVSRAFTVSSDASVDAPALRSPAENQRILVGTSIISGTCSSGSQVSVILTPTSGTPTVASAACENGIFKTAVALNNAGEYSANITQSRGTLSSLGVPVHFEVVQYSTLADPIFTAPASNAIVAPGTVVYQGTCVTGSTVKVFDETGRMSTATCMNNQFTTGSDWSGITGKHELYAHQTLDGAISPSAHHVFYTQSSASGAVAPTILVPAEDSVVSAFHVAISGTCTAGAQVDIFSNSEVVARAFCAHDGTFEALVPQFEDGAQSISARQTIAGGVVSQLTAARNFSVVDFSLNAPAISEPFEGGLYQSHALTIAGTCGGVDHAVRVRLDEAGTPGRVLCEAECNDDATFTCEAGTTARTKIPEGFQRVWAERYVDGVKDAGEIVRTRTGFFTVDTVPPETPQLSEPEALSQLCTSTITLSGACEAGAIVSAFDGAAEASENPEALCSTTCSANETFSCEIENLAEGASQIRIEQKDAVGNVSGSLAGFVFVDSLAPIAAEILVPSDESTLNSISIEFSGTCETGASVDVIAGEDLVCSSECDNSEFACSAALDEGDYLFSTVSADSFGNVSESTSGISVTVDRTAPTVPSIGSPSDSATLSSENVIISGVCESGSTIFVLENEITLCEVPCLNGEFSCETQFSDGAHRIVVIAEDDAGNRSASSEPIEITVDSYSSAGTGVTSPTNGGYVSDATPTVSGTANPGEIIVITENGEEICRAEADENGNWICTPSDALSEGSHTVVIVVTDGNGHSTTLDELTFIVDTTKPDDPIFSDNSGSYEAGQVVLMGTAEPGATAVLLVDGEEVDRQVVDESGNWRFVWDAESGEHTLTVTIIDAAGNSSSTTENVTVEEGGEAGNGGSSGSGGHGGSDSDGDAGSGGSAGSGGNGFGSASLPAPAIQIPIDNYKVRTRKVHIAGKGEAKSLLTVRTDGSAVLCRTEVDGLGNFECNVELFAGDYTIYAIQELGGQLSDRSNFVHFEVEPDLRFVGGGACSMGFHASPYSLAGILLGAFGLFAARPRRKK